MLCAGLAFRTVSAQVSSYAQLTADSLLALANDKWDETKYEESSNLYLLAHEKYVNQEDYKNGVESINYANYIDYVLLKDVIRFNKNALTAYELGSKYLEPNSPEYIYALEQYATSQYSLANYQDAIHVYQQILDAKVSLDYDNLAINNTRKSLANCYKFLGDKEKALLYYKSAVTANAADKAEYLYGFARLQEHLGNVESALDYINQCISGLKYVRSKQKRVLYLLTASEMHSNTGNFSRADEYLKRVSQIKLDNNYYKIFRLESSGKNLQLKEKHQEALHHFLEAQALAEESGSKNTSSFKSKRYKLIYESYLAQKDTSNCIKIIEGALLANQINNTEISLSSASDYTNKLETLFYLKEYTRFVHEAYLKSKELNTLDKAFELSLLTLEVIINLRQELSSQNSKTGLLSNNEEVFATAVDLAYELHQRTQKKSYLKKAFTIIEQNKALQLLETINNEVAQKFASLPDSIVTYERELTLSLNQVKEIYLDDNNKASIKKRAKSRIDELEVEKDRLKYRIERDYPKYYKLKYAVQNLSYETITRDILSDNRAIVEYFVTDKDIYSLALHKADISMFKIEKSDLMSESIKVLSEILSRPPSSKNAREEYSAFLEHGSTLFNLLLKEQLNSIHNNPASLIVIPDKELANLPFEILIQEVHDRNGYRPKNIRYVLNDYTLSYQYSIQHVQNLAESSVTDNSISFAGFAPTFSDNESVSTRNCSDYEIKNLSCTEDEINVLLDHVNGESYNSTNASIDNFINTIDRTDIIHLATHACLDTISPNLSRLYFSDGDMTMLDLNSYKMNAKLAVLSACETGIGEYISGDGIRSLAWSFMEAGCKSTVMSMWSVDDCTTSKLMELYYVNLKKGQHKDAALHKAKLEFLRTMDASKQHPFYWSSFITYGSMKPIFPVDQLKLPKVMAGLLLVSLLFFYFFKPLRVVKN